MSIQIYNTLSREKERFVPQEEGKVSFYVCGPTVYNYIHIGNARSAVAFDTIRRYLEYRGYEVDYVMNFTDVDDKIIQAAKDEGLSPKEIADKYIQAFKEDTGKIQVKEASVHPRVTDNMTDIIAFIKQLIDKGYAYEAEGDVFFKTTAFESYGKLSDQSLDDLLVGASDRLEESLIERKDNPLDFTLWKQVKDEGEISWESPWGQGRPGWHIECSVMSTKYLGKTLDIHGGGMDLTFPHHENERAQSEACTQKTFVNYWMHNGFVTLGADQEKMSKSLGNFVLLRDLLAETDPMVVRYLLASVHYRRPLSYDAKAVDEAQAMIQRFKDILRRLAYRLKDLEVETLTDDSKWLEALDSHQTAFIQAMDDDFNAANGITEILNFIRTINHYLEGSECSRTVLEAMRTLFNQLIDIYGLNLDMEDELLDDAIQALIDERTQARLAKDFARSDAIRDQLKAQGIQLDDTPQGTQWKRV